MSELYKIISGLCEQRGISNYRMCKELGIQPSVMTDLKMGRKKSVNAETANKIASFFGVSVGYLLGTEKEKTPIPDGELPHAKYREVLQENGVRILLDADTKISQDDLDDIVEFIKFKQRKNGR